MVADLSAMANCPDPRAASSRRAPALSGARRGLRSREDRPIHAVADSTTRRLREVVHRSGGTKQVAARAGVALSTLGSYLAGGEMKLSTAKQLCAACGVSLAWLIGESQGPRPGWDDAQGAELVRIPCARPATEKDADDATDTIAFSSAWIRGLDRPAEQLQALKMQGSAMEPSIRPGDLLLIDTGVPAIASLEIHVIEVEGELLVRRLERCLDGSIVVRTDNDRFAPQVLAGSDRQALRIVGRVIWKGGSTAL